MYVLEMLAPNLIQYYMAGNEIVLFEVVEAVVEAVAADVMQFVHGKAVGCFVVVVVVCVLT